MTAVIGASTLLTDPRNDDVAMLRHRVRAEFLEMPGLRIGPSQAARLWAVDETVTSQILDDLVESGFLWKTPDGAYLRT